MDILSIGFPVISTVSMAVFVSSGRGEPLHADRPWHGFAFNVSVRDRYVFDDGKALEVNPGEIIYLPKHSNYTVRAQEPGDCYAINFDFPDERRMEPFVIRPEHPGVFLEDFRAAETVWRHKQTGYYADTIARLYAIFGRLQRERDHDYVSRESAAILDEVRKYLAANYTDPTLRVADLAAVGGVSEVWLRKLFRAVLRTSPAAYIASLRLERAKELISAGTCSVGEAARLSGYGDEAYFSREFKRRTGVSPSAYPR